MVTVQQANIIECLGTPNILYEAIGKGKYTFQLADFGMANHFRLANTICGTPLYRAPEIYAELYGKYPQTPKMDVWSLFATVAEIHPCFDCPPKDWSRYEYIKRAVEAAADSFPKFKPMTRVNPEHRASAVKMLIRFYDGQGLTTPRADIPDLEPDCPKPTPTVARAELTPRQAPLRLVEYPRRRQHAQHARPAPRPAPRPDILQNRPLSGGQPFTQTLRARVQQGGIVIRVAQQTKPEPRRPQEKQRRETWPQELPPPSYRKEPPQRGGKGNIQTSRTADSVVPMESVATPCLQGMFPV
jgi:serine/threonine protein kinase